MFLKIQIVSFLICNMANVVCGQSPLDHGKTNEQYFISSSDIDELGIELIHSIQPLNDLNGMHGNVDFYVIDLSEHDHYVSDMWHSYLDTTSVFDLDTLIQNSRPVNGEYWSFENGHLISSGLTGYGSLCHSEYDHYEGYALVDQYCKWENETRRSKIAYHTNGSPKYSACCEILEMEEEKEEIEATYMDTVFYDYDKNWKYEGLRIKELNKDIPERNELYVNRQPFSIFVDEKIGYRPQMIVLEIYRNAAFTFTYSNALEKYVRTETYNLE